MASKSVSPPTTGPAVAAPGTDGAARQRLQDRYGNSFEQERVQGKVAGDVQPAPAVGGPRTDAPRTKAAALDRHRQNRARMTRIVQSALSLKLDPSAGLNSRPNMLRNTAQWIDGGEATLHVLSPTHDAEHRPTVAADQSAWFKTGLDYKTDGADYDATKDASGNALNDAGLQIDFSNVGGSLSLDGKVLTIIDPLAESEGTIVTHLIHEVQHDADQHDTGEAWETKLPGPDPAALERAPQWVYNVYQTEFRAYWLMNQEGKAGDDFGLSTDPAGASFNVTVAQPGPDGAYATADDTSVTVPTAFANARQEAIFNHMFEGGRADNVYYDGTNWTQSYGYLAYFYGLDPAFKAMVDRYTHPVSGNAVNSPRIQALSDAISAGGITACLAAAQKLDDLDRTYLQDRAQSQPLWDQLDGKLSVMGQTLLTHAIDVAVVAPAQSNTVEVQAGDTLAALADRYLHDRARWREIYRLNRTVIGADSSKLVAGTQLKLPAA
ncbi:MAG: LysM peptidoglycan-binding domain-containing protein [Pseudomonadota bacterium]|nr:LysM peptidoglycan-binding domain-containing protein [Pseudomonadota bacterium]